MNRAKVTYTKEITIDLDDPTLVEELIPFLRDNGVDGTASPNDIHDAIRASLQDDPDTLLPRFDDLFDDSDCVIEVDEDAKIDVPEAEDEAEAENEGSDVPEAEAKPEGSSS